MPQNENHECCCEKPGRLEGKLEECTSDRIRECHAEGAEHPCCRSSAESK